ncbi:MAG TPA: DUF1993 domain-containing protein [Polyangiaceae bacterium]|nr:DUF1993 domain-containing protein [Polyangiaceae bacterium]
MYYQIIRQFAFTLKNLDAILTKAERYADARGFDVNNLLSSRLAPDMLPFVAQVRIACDNAKFAAANLAKREAPKHEDNEKSFEELHARIAKVLAFLDGFSEADFAQTKPDTKIPLAYPPGKFMHAIDYATGRQIPNFYFHVVTAYDILRQGGVELSKVDYLGAIPMLDS